jgi:hypothetical protein
MDLADRHLVSRLLTSRRPAFKATAARCYLFYPATKICQSIGSRKSRIGSLWTRETIRQCGRRDNWQSQCATVVFELSVTDFWPNERSCGVQETSHTLGRGFTAEERPPFFREPDSIRSVSCHWPQRRARRLTSSKYITPQFVDCIQNLSNSTPPACAEFQNRSFEA